MRLDNISETWKKNKRKEEEEGEDGDSAYLYVYKVLFVCLQSVVMAR